MAEHSDLSCHECIFNAQFLLNQACPQTQQPEVNKLVLRLSSLNQPAEAYLQKHDSGTEGCKIPEALIVRCLAAALPESAILNRLFEDQLKGDVPFTEAEHILWHVYNDDLPDNEDRRGDHQLTIYCPVRWTGEIAKNRVVECEPFIRYLENDV